MLEWSEFAQRLGRELAGLERDTILIVREREESRHYVQAMREPDRLYAEAVSNNFLDGPLLLTLADEEVMSEAGWRPPAEPSPRNWWTELPSYATSVDYARLADVMVTALRDVQAVRRPSDLVYESFHRHGTGLIELLDFGIDTADPSRVTKRRASSAEDAGRPGPVNGTALEGMAPSGTGPAGAAPAATGVASTAPEGRASAGPAVRAGVPEAAPPDLSAAGPDTLEPRLADAKQRGDHTTYFELLLSADLVLPAGEAASGTLPTITIGGSTYATVFTSPEALGRNGGRQPYRRTTFAQLSTGWPDPSWQLAINPGLPSEIHLDAAAIARLDANQRAATPGIDPKDPFGPGPARPTLGPAHPETPPAHARAESSTGDLATPAAPDAGSGGHEPVQRALDPGVQPSADPAHTAIDPYTVADLEAAVGSGTVPAEPLTAPTPREPERVPIRPPHGTRLWQWSGESETTTPVAVYDAIGGVWAPVRADAVPAPGAE